MSEWSIIAATLAAFLVCSFILVRWLRPLPPTKAPACAAFECMRGTRLAPYSRDLASDGALGLYPHQNLREAMLQLRSDPSHSGE
jgi:hypothetical protein